MKLTSRVTSPPGTLFNLKSPFELDTAPVNVSLIFTVAPANGFELESVILPEIEYWEKTET